MCIVLLHTDAVAAATVAVAVVTLFQINGVIQFYAMGSTFSHFAAVSEWRLRIAARPAVIRAMIVNKL